MRGGGVAAKALRGMGVLRAHVAHVGLAAFWLGGRAAPAKRVCPAGPGEPREQQQGSHSRGHVPVRSSSARPAERSDQYVLTHTVWLEQVLRPVYDGTADQVVKDTLAPVIAHIEAAHLERSPLQQVDDILAADQYVLTHTVWLGQVLAPTAEQLTC